MVLNHMSDIGNLIIGLIFLLQTTIGILGNFSLMFYYAVLYYREHTLKPIDMILFNLTAANIMIVLSSGLPHTITPFVLRQLLNYFGCRLIFYIERVGRSLSIGTSCLLSVFQAMTISPREYCWKDHKVKVARSIGCIISLLWLFYILMHFIFFIYPFIERNGKNRTRTHDFGYCFIVLHNEITDLLFVALVMFPEVLFSLLIIWSSGFMIVILYRHKQRVQHIRRTHGSSTNFPESRATKNILALVSTFLNFYTLSSILEGSIALSYDHNRWLINFTSFTSLCFPSFGPFVLMNHYSFVSRFSFVC
ncbi:vomeronasal type-1 receptor 2-like [Arvicola amphibius]|uniref:vomeronasal type-1 receptor 2-like n=1 Tax=Arvicola amphibius TaxID=1047088 RepID=UPI0018E2CB6B|nr:vomeronasal type-1 receptor 2-like [Arvicola amphibius]